MKRKHYWPSLTDEQKHRIGSTYQAYGAIKTLDWLEQEAGIQVGRDTLYIWLKRIGALTPGRPAANLRSPRWTMRDVVKLNTLYPNQTIPPQAIASALGRSWDTIRKKAASLNIERSSHANINDTNTPNLDVSPLLILSDLHAPFHDRQWIDRVTAVARAWNTVATLLVGDALHPALRVEDISRHWQHLESHLLRHFHDIYWLIGGLTHHRARLLRPILDTYSVIARPDRVTLLDWHKVAIGEWMVAHELSQATEYAQRSRTHLITTWTHVNAHYWQQFNGVPRQIVQIGPACKVGTRCHRLKRKASGQLGAALMWKKPSGDYDVIVLHPDMDLEAVARMNLTGRKSHYGRLVPNTGNEPTGATKSGTE